MGYQIERAASICACDFPVICLPLQNMRRELSTAFLSGGYFAIGFSGKFQPLMRYPIVYITDLHLIFFRRQVTSGGSWGYFCYTEGAGIQISASYMQFWVKITKSALRTCILFDTEWWQRAGHLRIRILFDMEWWQRVNFQQNWNSQM